MAVAVPKPWERIDKETQPAWEAFVIYRDLSFDRALHKVAAQLTKSEALIRRWSARWKWVARCRAYDDMIDERGRQAHLNEVIEMRRRHTKLAMAMQGVGGAALKNFQKRDSQSGEVTVTISAHEAARLLKEGVTIERISRGEPDTINESRETDVDSALEREVQRLLDDPQTRRDLDRAGAGRRFDKSDPGLNGGGDLEGGVDEDETS